MIIPYMKRKIKARFETTNQIISIMDITQDPSMNPPSFGAHLDLLELGQVLVHQLKPRIRRVVPVEPKLGVAGVVVLALEMLGSEPPGPGLLIAKTTKSDRKEQIYVQCIQI